MTTFLILALVFFGAFKLTRIVIILAAAAYETARLRRIIGPTWIPTVDAVLDQLIRREWIEAPRRRPSPA